MNDTNRRRSRTLLVALPALLALGAAGPARAGGRRGGPGTGVVSKFSGAVVTVKLAVKMRISVEGREQEEESTAEISATMVDPKGLAVCALSEADPTTAIGRMMEEDSSTPRAGGCDGHEDSAGGRDGTARQDRLARQGPGPGFHSRRQGAGEAARVHRPDGRCADPGAGGNRRTQPHERGGESHSLGDRGSHCGRGEEAPPDVCPRAAGPVLQSGLSRRLRTDGKIIGIIVNRFPPPGAHQLGKNGLRSA